MQSTNIIPLGAAKAERIKALQKELKAITKSEITAVLDSLREVIAQAETIGAGGDAYHPGIRDDMTRTAEQIRYFIARIERLQNL